MPPKGRGRGRVGQRQDQGEPRQPGGQQRLPQGRDVQRPEQQQQPYQPQGRPKPTEKQVLPESLEFEYKCAISKPFPPKPKPGELGRKIRLVSNCFPLSIPSGNVYHYDIEIISKGRSMTTRSVPKEPEKAEKKDTKYRCMSTKRNREVINIMLEVNDNFNGQYAAYDGRKNLYTRTPLKINEQLKCEVVMPDENPLDPNPRPDKFEVIIKPVQKKETNDCSISLDPLHALFHGQVTSVPQEAVMALETVLRHGPCIRYFPVGRSFFYPPDPRDVHPLGGGKEIWFGYHQSLLLGQWKPMVNLDITATTFYEKGPLLKYVKEILNIQDLNRVTSISDADTKRLTKELKNMRIETNHLKKYKRKYRILRFTREPANRLEFELTENGKTVRRTVANYFEKQYGRLNFPHFPCIQANPETKKVYLPIEVCDMIEGQHCKKKLEDRQNAEMIKFTARPPKKRFEEIQSILKGANFNQDRYMQEFGMRVATRPLDLTGRVIEPPHVRYQNETSVKPVDGSWDMRDKQYFRGAEINSWVLLSFSNPRFCKIDCLERFAKLLCNIAHEQGIRINRPAAIDIVDTRRQTIQNVLKDVQNKLHAELAVIVVPGNNKAVYGEVKQAAETGLGLVTQCIKDENVTNPKKCSPPLVSNLCQKINAKMGGVNNSLTPGETPPILRRPVIIIGADVTHPSPSQDIKPSIAAAVGSLDAHPSRYAVTIRAQTNVDEKKQAVEIIQDLSSMILDLLKAFYRNTKGKKPEKIIFYRDGVSEGQFDKVRDHEVKCIREACSSLEKGYQPGITFIVVQKRHHTRFMPEDDRKGVGRMRNIPPGTTVDTEVVHPVNFDFFLCSHFGLQGTSRPCHYTVIEDDNDFTADDLQKLTYYLCHTYVRCTKSISCPAPVMYAHLAAFRARQHLLTQMDESSASSDTSSSFAFHPIPESVVKAIKVADGLKNTMYFV